MEGATRYESHIDLSDENNAHTLQVLLAGRDKRVLEAGPASGYITQALRGRGCRVTCVEFDPEAARAAAEFAERMIVGDIEKLDFAEAFGDERFDVAMYGDVLEHLVDPEAVLRRTREVLAPGGCVVASIPNIAHGSVRLALLGGTFRYTEQGLLDRTHLRFFTRESIAELFHNAGFEITELRRVVKDPFDTEVTLPQGIPGAVAEAVRADEEAMTYQFVVVASPAAPGANGASGPIEASESPAVRALQDHEAEFVARGRYIQQMEKRLSEVQARAALADRYRADAEYLWGELQAVQRSIGYRVLQGVRRPLRWMFPYGSVRGLPYWGARRVLTLGVRSARVIRREGLRAFAGKARGNIARRLRGGGRRFTVPKLDNKIRPLTFPRFEHPRVAIIIPVYNNALRTYNCLKWLLQNTHGVEYRVIVADDASTDETPEMLRKIENITAVRGAQNSGFVGNCNRGLAEAGDAEFVVYLNNDVYVSEGWLTHLLAVMESDSSVGIVGPKYIYPTGRLQEAGGIVWSDATTWAYGRDDDPDRPEYNYLREVDYCSAAALLVRGSLLREIGGFDTRFAPAYFEDTDIAFEARRRGYRTLYQPLAEVIHWEGSSSQGQFSERMQARNRPIFLEKWREVLETEHLLPDSDKRLARDRRRGRQVMVIDYHVPTYDQGGGEMRIFQVLKIMHSLGYSVTLFPADLNPMQPYTREIQQAGVEVLYGETSIQALGPSLETVIISRPEIAQHYVPLLRRYAPQATLIYDTVDLHWVRESRRADVENSDDVRREAMRLKDMELYAANACDATLVVSPVEKDILEGELPGVDVHVVPNVHPIIGCRKPFAEREGLLFIGYYPHLPNRDAMLYFIREIFPLVRERLPGVKLYAVGPEPGAELDALASADIVVTGWAPDLDPYLDGCRVFVSPLRYGAGIKGKIGQSFAYGLPVVTSTMGAEGMGLTDGETALITDDPREFADAVVRLYTDEALWSRLSESGLYYLERTYSPDVVREKLREMVETVRGGVQGLGAQCNICGAADGFARAPGLSCVSCGSAVRVRRIVQALGVCLGVSGPLPGWLMGRRLVLAAPESVARAAPFEAQFRFLPAESPAVFTADSIDLLVCGAEQRDYEHVYQVMRPGGYVVCDGGEEDVAAALAAAGFQAIVYRTAPPGAEDEQPIVIAQKAHQLTLGRPPA